MREHDIIVIAASAGGVEALMRLCGGLPADLPAAVFVVQHVSPASPSAMPQLLGRSGPLPACHPADGEVFRRGQIYVAPPDRHLLVTPDRVLLRRGPQENRTRPAADPLFRSAAVHHGPSVIGLVLTGLLDDGTAGLIAVKRCGGISLVQDPDDALWPDMPRNALLRDSVDQRASLAELPALLARLAREPAGPVLSVPDDVVLEARIAEQESTVSQGTTVGTPSRLSCPQCGGVLNEIEEPKSVRFRCQTGHAYGPESLAAAQVDGLEHALAAAVRTHRERVVLFRRMADAARARGMKSAAARWESKATEAEDSAALIGGAIFALKEATEPEPGG
ncbi:chemotaxis protein CheB [Roseomonas sp. BN140053]|uniref:chemotaxis protein CheB n=1 Tax=Roseomonas sp. BN140053 TaxID=3391898 RepID=UPI0039E84B72